MFMKTGIEVKHVLHNLKKHNLYKEQEYKAVMAKIPDMMDTWVTEFEKNVQETHPNRTETNAIDHYEKIEMYKRAAEGYRANEEMAAKGLGEAGLEELD